MKEVPKSLQHVLQVARRVRETGCSRIRAVEEVASGSDVYVSTVHSACTRSIGLSSQSLDDLLNSEMQREFRDLLVGRFPAFCEEIEKELESAETE